MMPFWCACWTAWQTCTNSPAAPWVSEFVVAVVGDGHALDQFHHEEGSARVGRAGVENLGDVGMIHQGQSLPLGLEAGQELLASPCPA